MAFTQHVGWPANKLRELAVVRYAVNQTGRGGKKKGDQVEVELVHSPAEYTVLASFHVPLKSFTEADFNPVVVTLSKEHPPPPPPDSPVDEVGTAAFLTASQYYVRT